MPSSQTVNVRNSPTSSRCQQFRKVSEQASFSSPKLIHLDRIRADTKAEEHQISKDDGNRAKPIKQVSTRRRFNHEPVGVDEVPGEGVQACTKRGDDAVDYERDDCQGQDYGDDEEAVEMGLFGIAVREDG
jgi:hypothetical protein